MSSRGAGGAYASRRGHVPHLSISDESHHVTETIGYMYDDDYDRQDPRHLSYISSPLGESLSTALSLGVSESPAMNQTLEQQSVTTHEEVSQKPNGQSHHDRENGSTPPLNRTTPETATTSFPLNDIDYESNPAAVAQELNNLAAIRRMSMDVAGDPDLPSFSNFQVPSLAPSSSADENDTSRLFWVPARLHPELAPKEFKSFLESKTEQIKRRSGEFSTSGLDRQVSGGSLRRKRSMLSRQIENPNGYTDGAERLERKRSEYKRTSKQEIPSPGLQDLEVLVDSSRQLNKEALSLLQGAETLDVSAEDKPILPPAPQGGSLRRSTRTQYRKGGSLKKGERLPYSKRVGKVSETASDPQSTTPATMDEPPPQLPLTRASTEPVLASESHDSQKFPRMARGTALPPGSTSGSTFESILEPRESSAKDVSPQPRQWHSLISSNGRSTLQIPPSAQRVPQIVETPPKNENQSSVDVTTQPNHLPERTSSHEGSLPVSTQKPPEINPGRAKRTPSQKEVAVLSSPTDIAMHQSLFSGNPARTDSLSFIPTITEDKKSDGRRVKEKKDTESSRKSSWHWLLGSEEKEKEKDRKRDGESKKAKIKQAVSVGGTHEKHDSIRLDALQTSADHSQRIRESLIFERTDIKLEEERRKESVRKSGGESKKEKESGLLSSIFGGVKKRGSGDGHKKNPSRNLSPDPPLRELRPDIDYHWTRFSILEERAIYRMAHIKLANPRRPLYSQVLLSNFMYSYLAKVQQMHPQMVLPTSAAHQKQEKSKDHPDEYSQFQRFQEQYGDNSFDEPQMYDYESNDRYRPQARGAKQSLDSGTAFGLGYRQPYGTSYSSFSDAAQLDDDDEMW